MIVNKRRLEKLISNDGLILEWLAEFDIPTALEEGAHIVNDRAIFPPQEVEITTLEDDSINSDRLEVIGNIHDELLDNFELLEDKL